MKHHGGTTLQCWKSLTSSGNSTDPCLNQYNSTCNSIFINGVEIISPALIPTCILAALIGYTGYTTIKKLSSCLGHNSYAITFAMYGCMMTAACFADSILPKNASTTVETIVVTIDVGLTSSIAMSFFWNGLVDMKIIQEWTSSTRKLMLFSYILIFAGWIYGLVNELDSVWEILYVDLITITCGLYAILEVISIVQSKDFTGVKYLLLAGCAGVAGIITRDYADVWLCHTFGCFFASSFWWFVFSDVAMYFVLRYYVARVHQRTEPTAHEQQVREMPQGYILLQPMPEEGQMMFVPAF